MLTKFRPDAVSIRNLSIPLLCKRFDFRRSEFISDSGLSHAQIAALRIMKAIIPQLWALMSIEWAFAVHRERCQTR